MSIGLPKNFYGVKTAQISRVSKCSNWIPFHEWVHSQISERYDNEDFRQQVAFNKSLDNIDLEDEICELVKQCNNFGMFQGCLCSVSGVLDI